MRSHFLAVLGLLLAGAPRASAQPAGAPSCSSPYRLEYRELFGLSEPQWKQACAPAKSEAASPKGISFQSFRAAFTKLDDRASGLISAHKVAALYGESGPVAPTTVAAPRAAWLASWLTPHKSSRVLRVHHSSEPEPLPSGLKYGSEYQAFEWGISRLPDSWGAKKGTQRLMELVGPRQYGSAFAVGSANIGLNGHFERLSAQDPAFRAKLAVFYAAVKTDGGDLKRRASLAQEAGKDELARLPPGWAWRKAFDVAHGDPDLAMNLIGFCGHDDRAQGTAAAGRFDCPSDSSALYLPKSLDAAADISPKLKKRIADGWASVGVAQDGAASVPAKYYHVYSAAAVTCEMIKAGSPPFLAKFLETKAAWVYRTQRVTNEARYFKVLRADIAKDHAATLKSPPEGSSPASEEDFAKTRVALDRMDAFFLLDYWGYGGKIWGAELPIVNHRLGWLDGRFMKKKPEGWTDARLAAAKLRLDTILVDWDWTTAQHAAGAAFAAKVCRKE